MTNPLEALRIQLAAALNTAQLDAHLTVPEAVTPPATFVGPSDPYITLEGASYGCLIVRHSIVIAVAAGLNEVTAGEVDRRLLAVLAVLPSEFTVTNSFVGQVPLNGQTYTGGSISVLTEIPIPDLEELTP